MKHFLIFLFFTPLLVWSAQSQNSYTILYDLNANGVELINVFNEELKQNLLQMDVNLTDYNAILSVFKEKDWEINQCKNNACQAEIGKLAGASKVIRISHSQSAQNWVVSLVLIDVASGKYEKEYFIKSKDQQEFAQQLADESAKAAQQMGVQGANQSPKWYQKPSVIIGSLVGIGLLVVAILPDRVETQEKELRFEF